MTWGHLRNLLGSCWNVLVPFLGVLEGSWRHLRVILGYLGGCWGGVGGILEELWVKFMDIFDTLPIKPRKRDRRLNGFFFSISPELRPSRTFFHFSYRILNF